MIKTEERTIRGIRLITSTIPVLEASVVWFRLGKVLSPAMVSLRAMTSHEKTKLVTTIAAIAADPESLSIATLGDLVGSLGPAFAEVFAKIDVAELSGMFRGLFGSTIAIRDDTKFEMGRSTEQINGAFHGDEGALWLAAFWVAGHNFKSFGFGRLASADATSKAADPSTSAT